MNLLNSKVAMALGLGLASAVGFAACDGPQNNGPTGVPGIEKFRRPGPEPVTMMRVGICTLFLPPMGPANSRGGLGWGNGTFTGPESYTGLLGRVASFGTLVTAANTSNAGTGNEISQCIDMLPAQRPDANGMFVAAGYSQGGSGAINASRLNARVITTCAVELDGVFTARSTGRDLKGSVTGPALIACGGGDVVAPCTSVNNGDTKLAESTVPTTRISVIGAPHVGTGSPVGNGGMFSALVTTCAEAAVGGDAEASAALQPGGTPNNAVFSRVSSVNFPAGGGDPGAGGGVVPPPPAAPPVPAPPAGPAPTGNPLLDFLNALFSAFA